MVENKFKKLFTSRAFLFILLLAFIWLGIDAVNDFYKKHQIDKEIAAIKKEADKINKNNQELNWLIQLQSNKNFLEEEAKQKLNLKKEGENVVIVDESALNQTAAIGVAPENSQDINKAVAPDKNNLIKWWRYFFQR